MTKIQNQIAKHTPGPWVVEDSFGTLWIWDVTKEKIIVHISNEEELKEDVRKEKIANTNLIAAAPELLSALIDLLDELEGEAITTGVNQSIREAKAAIQKATGGTI